MIYGTMYGNSEQMMEAVAEGVKSAGCRDLEVLDASRVYMSYLLSESWRREGLIIGSPTYDARIFPPLDRFVKLAKKKKLKNRIAGAFGSYGWSSGALEIISSAIDDMRWELIEPLVDFRGKPTDEDFERGRNLGRAVADRVMS